MALTVVGLGGAFSMEYTPVWGGEFLLVSGIHCKLHSKRYGSFLNQSFLLKGEPWVLTSVSHNALIP